MCGFNSYLTPVIRSVDNSGHNLITGHHLFSKNIKV